MSPVPTSPATPSPAPAPVPRPEPAPADRRTVAVATALSAALPLAPYALLEHLADTLLDAVTEITAEQIAGQR